MYAIFKRVDTWFTFHFRAQAVPKFLSLIGYCILSRHRKEHEDDQTDVYYESEFECW